MKVEKKLEKKILNKEIIYEKITFFFNVPTTNILCKDENVPRCFSLVLYSVFIMTDIIKTWFAVSKVLPLTAFFLAILFFIKYYYDKRRTFKLGSKLPGPKPLPIIGSALDFINTDPSK